MTRDVKIFSHPGKSVQGPPPHALFEGEYYSVQDAKPGDKLDNGNIIRTAPGSAAKVVYDNGDQFQVGSGTAYRVSLPKAKGAPQINLLYGKLRAVVEKGGPRTGMKIKTRSATMGVRGTDFFIADGGSKGTEIAVLRGEVEVKPEGSKAQAAKIPAGYTADIAAPPPVEEKKEMKKGEVAKKVEPAPVQAVEVRKVTQEDLAGIKKVAEAAKAESTIKAAVKEEEQLKKLEAKAGEATMRDIQKTDPKLYEEVKRQGIASADALNEKVIQKVAVTAPSAPEKRKPYMSELEDLENGAYDHYFKKVD